MTEDRFSDPAAFMVNLLEILGRNKVSQARIAREAGMDRHRINHYVKGRRVPTIESMLRLDDALLRILHQRAGIRRRVR